MFVALDLPEGARDALAVWRDALVANRSDLRPVRPEALHVTLVFLGWQDESAASEISSAAFAAAGSAAPLLRPAEILGVPPRDPRLFALDLEDSGDRATALQAAVSDALRPWYKPEKRPFWPHITLARVKRGQRRVPPLPADPLPPAEPFETSRLTLYRSTLRPQGALYESLAEVALS
jgi:2'-5' RNA ligase